MSMSRIRQLLCVVLTITGLLAVRPPMQQLMATAGDLDPSFGVGGIATAPAVGFGYTSAMAVQADGKIIAAGPDGKGLRIVRFNPDGSLDTGFGAGGSASADLSSEDVFRELPIKVLLREDGRIVVVATFDNFYSPAKVALLQYSPAGVLDPTFGNGGIGVHTLPGTLVDTSDAVLQADGGVLVAGHAYFNATEYTDFMVHRFTASGVIDQAFGPGGFVKTDVSFGDEAFAMALQPDGRFIVAGFTDIDMAPGTVTFRVFALVRYMADGTLDTSFGSGGRVMVDPALGTAQESWCHEVIVLPDGRIAAAGAVAYASNTTDAGVVRLLSDGQLDTSFSGDGRAIFAGGDVSNGIGASRQSPSRLAVQANGRLLVADLDVVLGVRPDGTLDPDFHGDGIARIPGPFTDMTLQDDGKIVIADFPSTPQGAFRVIRLLAENTPPALAPAAVSVQRGTAPRATIGTAADASDPLGNLVVAPVAATVPPGLSFTSIQINATTGTVTAVVSASCTAALGAHEVQFSITDGGNATTFATVPVDVQQNPLPSISIGDRSVTEGHTGFVAAQLTLTAAGTVCAPITVAYATADGTAAAPGDYIETSGTATIAVGQTSTTITVPVIGERVAENDEAFFVNLDTPLNATIADGQGVVTIRNDEPSVVQFAAVTALEVLEGDTASPGQILTFKLARLTGLSATALVNMSFSGTASYRSDFVFPGDDPFVTFSPGQTEADFRVVILGDLIEEGLETLTITITEWVNASIGTPSTAQITIRDNDGAPADPDAPIVTGTVPNPNAAGWYRADVPVTLSASDGAGSGVQSISYSLNGAAAVVVPSANTAFQVTGEGVTTVTFSARDVEGNVSAPQTLTVRLDKTAPGVTIGSPQARAYTVNEAAAAAYACTDGGSGVASCTGTTAPGAAIDTASIGAKSFSATATDLAGNTTTVAVPYTVVIPPPLFRIRALYDPLMAHNSGSAIPIRLQVENADGVNISSSNLIVEALFVSSGTEIGPAEEEALDAGQSNPLGRFRFVSDGAYLFNLKTTGLKPGPYVLVLRIAGDTALYAVPFLIR